MRVRSAIAIALLALTTAVSCGSQEQPTGQAEARSEEGRVTPAGEKTAPPPVNPAPDFSVETFAGDTFSLGEQRGTPVVLNFWESW